MSRQAESTEAKRAVRTLVPYGVDPVEHSLKPRIAVMAPSAADVVRFAGGWLFDQGMAGWEVNVLTIGDGDLRPLRILGAHGHDLDTVLASPVVPGPCLKAVAVGADLYYSDARVRQMLLDALQAGLAELRLWGDIQPADLDRGTGPVRHQLSIAARAFKAHALAAARVPAETATGTEIFCSLRGLKAR